VLQTFVIPAVSEVMIKRIIFFLLVLICSSSAAEAFDKSDLENWLKHAESKLARTDSYTAIFHKQELIQQKLTEEETIFLKFKKPFKVYMKWVKEPYKGRESLYIDGYNDNLIKVRECGLAGIITVDIDPKGTLAMKGNRHPVTHSGIENLVKLIRRTFEKGVSDREIHLREKGEERVYGRTTKKVEVVFPKNKANRYYCYRALMNFDVETKLPIRVQIYDWNDTLIESYGYEAITLDAGLTEADFDPNNPAYRF
jgi:outer membrane lipoprotein-sorting protein